MICKVLAFAALIGAAVAAPVISFGKLASGTSFTSTGLTTAGAAADKNSGIASSGIDGIGSVLGLAGPGFATGIALASPSA